VNPGQAKNIAVIPRYFIYAICTSVDAVTFINTFLEQFTFEGVVGAYALQLAMFGLGCLASVPTLLGKVGITSFILYVTCMVAQKFCLVLGLARCVC
jgi:hypothetical protein